MTPALFSHRKHWAARFGTAPFLPMSRAEMTALGWDACDIILVTGDAYIDHPSFGMALVGRLLEAQGYRVGIISQPDWHSADAFRALGQPTLYFGVTAGNMDSMVNRYTSDRKVRSDDAYTPGGMGGKRPDRTVVVYSQRVREAFKDSPIVIGGIEASLRRIAHFDYWSEKVRRSVLLDSKADILMYGNAERQIIDLSHRLAAGEKIADIQDLRGTAFMRKAPPAGWIEVNSTHLDPPGKVEGHPDPYAMTPSAPRPVVPASGGPVTNEQTPDLEVVQIVRFVRDVPASQRDMSYIRLPSYESVRDDPVMYAHASRILHSEANPGNARPLIQAHGNRLLWVNPPR